MSSAVTTAPITLLRTAAGSTNTVTQYRVFQSLGCRIVAADCDPASVGFHFAEAAQVVPRVTEPGYLEAILDLCAREEVTLFLPALDEELGLLAGHQDRFQAVGTRLLVSNPGPLAICLDKLLTYQFFKKIGIPTPRTVAAEHFGPRSFERYPLIVKPRSGRGSAGVHVARNEREAAFFCTYVENAVVQQALQGVEYTIDVLADPDSEVLILSPRQRLATESGISSKGLTHWVDAFLGPVRAMVKALGLVGPLNVQCFVSEYGEVAYTEINARLAGTAILSQAAGVPLFEGILDLACGRRPAPWLRPCEPMLMFRHWEETFLQPQASLMADRVLS
jgi:carbamoyl-phosphate synthase large subunit